MRTVFMGTAPFAVPSLSALAGAGHDIALVVTQPDRPKGRGRKTAKSAVKLLAEGLGLTLFQPERIRTPEAVETLADARPEVIVVAAFGQILPRAVLDIPQRGCLNVHASLLPKYRGAAPVNWAVIMGEEETGVTIMRMDEGMDTGDILLAAGEPVRPGDTAGALTARLAGTGAGLLVRALDALERDGLEAIRQDDAAATAAPLLKKETGRVDWGRPAVRIERLVRGLDPWPGAFTTMRGETLKLWKAVVSGIPGYEGAPGEIVEVNNRGIKVMTSDGVLAITELQAVGGRRMTAREYLAGHEVKRGERLGA